jgi:hypothetical protein
VFPVGTPPDDVSSPVKNEKSLQNESENGASPVQSSPSDL